MNGGSTLVASLSGLRGSDEPSKAGRGEHPGCCARLSRYMPDMLMPAWLKGAAISAASSKEAPAPSDSFALTVAVQALGVVPPPPPPPQAPTRLAAMPISSAPAGEFMREVLHL